MTVVQLWTPRIKALDARYKAATSHPRILTGDLGRSLRSAGAIGADPDTA